MTRLQSFVGIMTVLACVTVSIWTSQRPPSSELIAEIPPPRHSRVQDEPVAKPPIAPDDALIQAILDEEHADPAQVIPRKLSTVEETPAADHPVRRLILRELPDATDEEREIWFEQLRDLPLTAVEDLLKVRRDAAPLANRPDAIAPQKLSATNAAPNSQVPLLSPKTRSTLQRYRALLVQNLLNADTVGYRSVEPRLSPFPTAIDQDVAMIEGLRWIDIRLSLKPGTLEITDRSLDLAIAGAGWFVVADEEGKLAFTRNGSFEVNDQRSLELMTVSGPRSVHPPIILPEKVAQVFIDTNGTIYGRLDGKTFDESPVLGHIQLARFFDDCALQLAEDGLYHPLPKAGEMARRSPGDQCGSLREGMLERSNVNIEAQQLALRRVENWLAWPTDALSEKLSTDRYLREKGTP